jgi:hypothetical protein
MEESSYFEDSENLALEEEEQKEFLGFNLSDRNEEIVEIVSSFKRKETNEEPDDT